MAKQRILIADDDPAIREVVRLLLEGAGYDAVSYTHLPPSFMVISRVSGSKARMDSILSAS